jgi:hypothetical protein
MVVWMTSAENRILETAIKRGYLFCRRDQRMLVDQWSSYCHSIARPVLRVERHGQQQCQVILQWQESLPALQADQLEGLRQLLQVSASAPGLLPIVFRYGAYSGFMDAAGAENLARSVAEWVEAQL